MLRKFGSSSNVMTIEKAAGLVTIPDSAQALITAKDPGFVYFISRAIKADVPNGNGDMFPWDEVQASYKTFVGKHIDYNHKLDKEDIIGKIVDAWLDDPTKSVFILGRVDRTTHPTIARQIEVQTLDHVSMEAMVNKSICSICGHTIRTDKDAKCDHLSKSLLKECVFEGKTSQCYAVNRGINFTGLGVVLMPAEPSAEIFKVYAKLVLASQESGADKVFINAQIKEILDAVSREPQKIIGGDAGMEKDLVGGGGSNESTIQAALDKIKGTDYVALEKHFADLRKAKEVQATVVPVETKSAEPTLVKEDTKVDVTAKVEEKVGKVAEVIPAAVAPVAPVVEAAPVAEVKVAEVDAEFVHEAKIEESYWKVIVGGQPAFIAKLADIWGEQLSKDATINTPEGAVTFKIADYGVSPEYRSDLLGHIKSNGLEATMKLIGANEWPGQKSVGKGQYDIGLKDLSKKSIDGIGIELKDTGYSDPSSRPYAGAGSGDKTRSSEAVKTEYKAGTHLKGDQEPAGTVKVAEEIPVAPVGAPVADAAAIVKPKWADYCDYAAMTPEANKAVEDEKAKLVAQGKNPEDVATLTEAIANAKKNGIDIPEVKAALEAGVGKKADEDFAAKLPADNLPALGPAPKMGDPGKLPDLSKEPGKELDLGKPPIVSPKGPGIGKPKEPKITTPEQAVEFVHEAIEFLGKNPELKSDIAKLEKGLDAVEKSIEDDKKKAQKEAEKENKAKDKEEAKAEKESPKEEKKEEKAEEKGDKKEDKKEEAAEKKDEIKTPVMPKGSEEIKGVEKTADAVVPVVAPVLVAEKSARETQLEQELSEMKVQQSLKAKHDRCVKVVQAMIDREMVVASQLDIDAACATGMELLGAQGFAFRKAADRQVSNLMKMDRFSLDAFETSIMSVRKSAAKISTGISLLASPQPGVLGDASFMQSLPWS